MTLREFWLLICRYWILVIVLTIIGALCGIGYSFTHQSKESYQASAYIVAGSGLSSVTGFAENAARTQQQQISNEDVSINVDSDTTNMTVTITASGPNPESCINAANEVANLANNTAIEIYSQNENPYHGEIALSNSASHVVSINYIKYAVVGGLAGLFIAFLILVIFDMKKRPIKTIESLQRLMELPLLETFPAENGDKLLANIQFSSEHIGMGKDSLRVLFIPTAETDIINTIIEYVQASNEKNRNFHLEISQAKPLSESIDGAYESRQVDAVVVVVRQWEDSVDALESTIEELRFAEAKIAGLVFVKNKTI